MAKISKKTDSKKFCFVRKSAFIILTLITLNSNLAIALDTTSDREFIISERNKNAYGFYAAKSGDTIAKIAKKYNGDANIIHAENSDIAGVDSPLPKDKQIKIPVSELRNTLKREIMIAGKTSEPEISYSLETNTIKVSGKGSVASITDINNSINNPTILQNLGNKEWLLRANLLVTENASLIIDGNDTIWLKILSNAEKFATIKSNSGNILIKNTKITSWDEENNSVDLNDSDGRSFVLMIYNGRMDIENSEIAYLGNKLIPEIGGGSYGISYRIPKNTFKKYLVAGNIKTNKIHHNYYGIYTFGATGMKIENNEVYENIQYGIDPHDDSNNLSIRGNIVHNNGNHGIITSKRCFYNLAKFNTVYGNRLHGMMLDKQSNFTIFENNTVFDNLSDGIAVYDSHYNIIDNNEVRNAKSGVRISFGSTKNYVETNTLSSNKNGVLIYGSSNGNYVLDNIIFNNTIGISIKDSTENIIQNNLKNGDNLIDLKLLNADGNIIDEPLL